MGESREAEKFETGFLYVRSPFESRKEKDFITKEIERVAKAKNINLNIYHVKEDTSKLGLKQNSLTFAFYQDGEVKKKLDFIDLSEDDIQILSPSIGCITGNWFFDIRSCGRLYSK
ncbi:hypothetical protein [Peribacillus simplex]|uniref:hypothetical protein n=1 Tax=Peribacillus simplex TaxID=1478 RepID=UPI00114105E1|nr:hypothetical protein [Peribacillus simplex]